MGRVASFFSDESLVKAPDGKESASSPGIQGFRTLGKRRLPLECYQGYMANYPILFRPYGTQTNYFNATVESFSPAYFSAGGL
jgi:hypothetical protein